SSVALLLETNSSSDDPAQFSSDSIHFSMFCLNSLSSLDFPFSSPEFNLHFLLLVCLLLKAALLLEAASLLETASLSDCSLVSLSPLSSDSESWLLPDCSFINLSKYS